MTIYSGYVYIWYDTKAKLFYIGGHHGKVEDSYICSNKAMKRAYSKRPNTFKFRVLEYVYSGLEPLREAEQKWLDKIKDKELYWTENIYNDTVKYYNMKKVSKGGSQKGHKKNRTKPAWNKGLTGVIVQTDQKRRKCSEKMKETWAKRKAASSVSRSAAHPM